MGHKYQLIGKTTARLLELMDEFILRIVESGTARIFVSELSICVCDCDINSV